MSKLTLISFAACPFVQRAIIALKEKGASFEVVYVDLAQKPDWFLAISPLGKVPVLKVERPGQDDAVVFESAVILEYLEETADGPPLHPADPLERAQHRSWMEFGSALLGDLFRFSVAKDEDEQGKARAALNDKLKRVEDVLGEGPFFAGEGFSYVDAVFAPAFRQISVLQGVAPHGLLDHLPKVAAWSRVLLARPSVKAAVPADFAELFLGRLRSMESLLTRVAA